MKVNVLEAVPLLVLGLGNMIVQGVKAMALLIGVFAYHIWTGKRCFPFANDIKWILAIREKWSHRKKKETALQGTP